MRCPRLKIIHLAASEGLLTDISCHCGTTQSLIHYLGICRCISRSFHQSIVITLAISCLCYSLGHEFASTHAQSAKGEQPMSRIYQLSLQAPETLDSKLYGLIENILSFEGHRLHLYFQIYLEKNDFKEVYNRKVWTQFLLPAYFQIFFVPFFIAF